VLPKVLSLGADAEVLEPVSFRQAVADSVREMAAAYGQALS
jgi:predicted DNA-binding transcriptional regulator YafY